MGQQSFHGLDVQFEPYFTHNNSPLLHNLQAEGRPAAHKQWSFCVFDDLLEYASSSAVKYKEFFLQPMLKCICDKFPPVRQV